MRFYTEQECEAWLSGRERVKPDAVPETLTAQMPYPPTHHRVCYFAHWIASSLTY
jgi:hypothetical protein